MIKAQSVGFLNTPALWENHPFDVQQFAFPSLKLTSFSPSDIPQNIRLGHQMEHVFKQLIQFAETHEILLHNLPIRNAGITIGEIDFILKEKSTARLLHVELTYKFYLIDPEIADPIHSLVGPNRNDTFFAKMEKIKHKQFPLLHTEEGIHALLENGIDHKNITHQSCFKAQLYTPFDQRQANLGTFNPDCIYGFWLRLADFKTSTFEASQYYIPTKSEWVIAPHANVDWKTHTEILVDLEASLEQEKAPMLWAKHAEMEFEKLFVVWW